MAVYDIRKSKINLRNTILDKRNMLSIAEIQEKSLAIKEALFDLSAFKEAHTVMFFVSFRSEVMTDFMIKEALALGKKVAAPRSVKHTSTLQTYYLNDFYTDLSFGAYGILEPKSDRCKRADTGDIDMVIVPGSAFTRSGDRVGYGAGYYDRFFGSLPEKALKVALAFELQIVDDISVSETDVKVDMIITEEGIIRCKD